MRATAKLTAPALDKLPVAIEYNHAVWFFAGRINGMVDVYVTLRVFANAMCVAVLNIGWKLAPVMCDLVSVLSGTKDWLFAPRFARSTKNERCDKAGSKLSEKSAARYRHLSSSY